MPPAQSLPVATTSAGGGSVAGVPRFAPPSTTRGRTAPFRMNTALFARRGRPPKSEAAASVEEEEDDGGEVEDYADEDDGVDEEDGAWHF